MSNKQGNSNPDSIPSDLTDPNALQDAADAPDSRASVADKAKVTTSVSSTGTIRVNG
jgi:hypothetical protein